MGRTNGADDGSLWRYNLEVVETEVSGVNLLANLEGSHVHVNHVRKVLEKSLDIELAYRDDELTTELDTLGVAAYPYRNCDSHRLVLYDSEEIDVEALGEEEERLRAYYYPENGKPQLFIPFLMPKSKEIINNLIQ